MPLIGALALLIGGAGGMWAWDHHGPLGFHTRILFWNVGFDLPASLAQRVDAAEKAEKTAAQAALTCRGYLDAQNASISAQAARGAQALADTRRDLDAARPRVAAAQRASAALAVFAPQGPDVCARYEDADRAVLEALNAMVIP